MTAFAADRLTHGPRGPLRAVLVAALVVVLVVLAFAATRLAPTPTAATTWSPRGGSTSVLYVLHGFAGSPGDALGGYHLDVTTQSLVDAGYIAPVAIVALDAGQRWGTDVDLWGQIQAHEAGHPVTRRYVAGFSMGGYLALELAYEHPGQFAGVGAVSPAIAPPDRPWVPALAPVPLERLFLGYGTEDHPYIIEQTDALGRQLGVTPVVVPGGHDLVVQLALIPPMLRELLGD